MTNPDPVREQAANVLHRRTLDKLSARIADPVWRDRAQQFASGRMSAQDVLAYIEQSPAVMRSFDRHLIKLTELSGDELDALRQQRGLSNDRCNSV